MLNQKQKLEITDSALESLQEAAAALQGRYPELSPEAISRALGLWLESSIESLAEDAAFHCAEGRDDIAFNRYEFNWAIKQEFKKLPEPVAAAA